MKSRIFSKQKKDKTAFKVVSVSGAPATHDAVIKYQLQGKSTISEDTAKALFDELAQIKGFSKNDSNLIIEMTLTQLLTPKHKIIAYDFSENDIIVSIQDVEQDIILQLSPQEILSITEIKSSLSSTDLELLASLAEKEKANSLKRALLKVNAKKQVKLHVYHNKK